jgi:hypothetical protein
MLSKEYKTNELKKFMKDRPHLIWYVKNRENLSVESIVEHTLNYGDWDDVQKLISILGINEIARIFKEQTSRPRINYHPKTKHYFNLYFKKYAYRDFNQRAGEATAIAV